MKKRIIEAFDGRMYFAEDDVDLVRNRISVLHVEDDRGVFIKQSIKQSVNQTIKISENRAGVGEGVRACYGQGFRLLVRQAVSLEHEH